MDRNKTNFFAEEAEINIGRSTWEDEFEHITTFNTGDLVPFYVNTDVLPAYTIKNTTGVLLRLMTPKYPTMGTLYCDTYYFAVPWWTVWDNAKKFFGENEDGAWAQTEEITIPKYHAKTPVAHDDIMSYMGIPQGYSNETGTANIPINDLGRRAYYRAYNFWFRNQNLIAPIKYSTGDETFYADSTIEKPTSTSGPAKILKSAKYYDYFRAALPEPQKGSAVQVPLGDTAQVRIMGNSQTVQLKVGKTAEDAGNLGSWRQSADVGLTTGNVNKLMNQGANVTGNIYFSTQSGQAGLYGIADLTSATAATINALRLAFATQRILEKDARFGTRYNEIIRGHFGVDSPNASLHVPEYLGGSHFIISIDQVLQTSSTDSTSPLGETGAVSQTLNFNDDFTKSFTEHTILLGLITVRQEHIYQQGVARMWTRQRRLDLYWPSLAHIGNQPIYNYEIYALNSNDTIQNGVFGYKEAWSEYRHTPSRISGMVSSLYTGSNSNLDEWTYADIYSSQPTLSQAWNDETKDFVDRTILIQSETADQWIADISVHQRVTAAMPIHSIPGLIDHF